MRNTMKKRIAMACMLAVGVSAVAGGVAANVSAGAEGSTFTLYDGASIRTANPAGIRFETTISGEEYEAYVAQEAKFGTVIIPESKLGENTLEVGLAGSLNIVAENFVEVVEDNEETTDVDESVMQYNAVLVGKYDEQTNTYAGLPKEMYNVKLVARSYVQVGTGTPVYATNTVTRSMAQVAGKAIADTTETYDADEYEYMHDITEYVATLEANTLTAVKVNTANETLNASISLPDACGEVYGVYVMANDSTVPTSAYAVEGNVVTFTDAFLKSLDYGKYTLKINAENGCYSVETEMYGEVADEAHALNFATNNSVANMTYDGATAWLPTFNGSNGVVSSVISNQWGGLKLKLSYTLEELQGMTWDYFAIKAYVENGNGSVYTPGWPSGFVKDAWKTVKLTKANVETLYGSVDQFYQILINGGDLFEFWDACTLYIDYVDFCTYNKTGVFSFDTSASDAEMIKDNLASVEWVDSFGDEEGIVKGTYTGGYSASLKFRANTTVANMQALDWEVLVVRVWFEETEANKGSTKPDPVNANWNINGLGSGPRGQWVSLCISKTNLAAQFTTIDAFYEAFVSSSGAMFTQVYNTAASAVYVDEILFTKYDRTMDFENANEISFLRTASATNIQWFESAKDDKGNVEDGVLSYNQGTVQAAGIKMQFNNWTGMTTADWDTIEIRIRILRGPENGNPGTDASFSTLYLDNDYKWTGSVNNAWSTLTMSKDSFAETTTWGSSISNFWSAFCGADGARILWEYNYVHTQGGWTFQIDYISLLKTA